MKFRYIPLLVGILVLAGCGDESGPTSARLEQAVFNVLGGLDVGESLDLSGEAAEQVVLGGQADSGDFVLIPFYASKTGNATLGIEVRGENAGAVPDLLNGSPPASSKLHVDPRLPANAEMHRRLRARFRAGVASKSATFRRESPGRPRLQRAAATPLGGSNARVDQIVQINTSVAAGFCTAMDYRTGRVEAITDGAIIVSDVDNPDGGFTRADFESFGREFDSFVRPTITDAFGEPTDIDDNGKVIIFFTRAVNELTTPGSEGFVGGFFYGRDLFPVAGEDPCPASNQGEIFYILAPDPFAEASHIPHPRDDVFLSALGTIGHEFQHLINSGRRIWVSGAQPELVWLDEGLSHIAEELLFYARANVEPESNISEADLTSQQFVDALNEFGVQNLVRYGIYLEDVAEQSPTDPDDDLATRGATWAFLRYAADHDPRSDAEFFRALVETDLWGYNNLDAVIDGTPLDALQHWGVSIFTDDWLIRNTNEQFEQPSWDFRSLLPLVFDDFPLETRTLGDGGLVDFEVAASSSGYIKFHSEADDVTHIQTTSGGASPPSSLRLTVVRVN